MNLFDKKETYLKFKHVNKLFVIFSFISLALLLAPTNFEGIAGFCCAGLFIAVLFIIFSKQLSLVKYHNPNNIVLEIVLIMILMEDFYLLWIVSSRVSVLAKRLQLSSECFLWIVACVLGIISLIAVDMLFSLISMIFKTVLRRIPVSFSLEKYIIIVVILFLECFQLEFSVFSSLRTYLNHRFSIVVINILIVVLLNSILLVVFQSNNVVLFITSCLFTIWSLVNYYVILYHGAPLFPMTLYTSGKTGLEIASGYNYSINYTVVCLVAIFLAQIWLIFVFMKKEKPLFSWKNAGVHMIGVLVTAGLLMIIFKGAGGFLPKEGTKETWNKNIMNYGFMISSVWDVRNHNNWLIQPNGYSLEELTSLNNAHKSSVIEKKDYPDIILILNESFCDLEMYTSIQADHDYLSDFYTIKGASFGYAITPFIGGGTNDSEFELLTSKSVQLLSTSAPFTYISRDLEGRSIVQYLKSIGYTTVGMHCGGETNYNRNVAYPAIGFDHILLGPDAFKYCNKNGNRSWLDADNYKDLINHYELNHDKKKFYFLVTFQNHGGYEQNDGSLDTVHTQVDYGNLTDGINEYLSSVELSAKAFKELTEYYSGIKRPVIICMVGDHAPSFITKLKMDNHCKINNSEIAMRMVPYVIWSNYGIECLDDSNYATMTDLVPILLKSSGMPLSSFYNTIIDIHHKVPIRTSDGLYMDSKGECGTIKDSSYSELIQLYYKMEYNSLLQTGDYRKELFLP